MAYRKSTTPRACRHCSADISALHGNTQICHPCKIAPRVRALRFCVDCLVDISARAFNAIMCTTCVYARRQARKKTPVERAKDRLRHRTPEILQRSRDRWRNDAAFRERKYERSRRYWSKPENRQRLSLLNKKPSYIASMKARQQHRRALKLNQLGSVTSGVHIKLLAAKHCGLCKVRFTKNNPRHIDHVQPLSKGGFHEDSNLQVLCRSCNVRKSNKDPIEFARQHGRLL